MLEVLLAGAASYWWVMSREPLAALVFVGVAVLGYCRPFFQTRQFLASFLVLLVATLEMPYRNMLVALYFTGLYGLLLGIKNLVFLHRKQLYYLASGLLALLVCVLFFSLDRTEGFLVEYLATGLALFLIAREFFVIFGVYEAQGIAGVRESEALELNFFENHILAKKNFIALVFAFVMLQLLWAILLLPIGFVNSSALAIMAILLIKNLAIHYVSGTFTHHLALKKIALFVSVWVIVFISSKWTL